MEELPLVVYPSPVHPLEAPHYQQAIYLIRRLEDLIRSLNLSWYRQVI